LLARSNPSSDIAGTYWSAPSRLPRAAESPRRVVPIAQTRVGQGCHLTLLSLENYADGFFGRAILRSEDRAALRRRRVAPHDPEGEHAANDDVRTRPMPTTWARELLHHVCA